MSDTHSFSNLKECFKKARDEMLQRKKERESNEAQTKLNETKTFTKDDFMVTEEKEYAILCEVVQKNAHFPTIHLEKLIKRKCEIELDRGENRKAGLTLLQYQAISFHHQALFQYEKRKANAKQQQKTGTVLQEADIFEDSDEGDADEVTTWAKEGESFEQMMCRTLTFHSPAETDYTFCQKLKKLPKEWRIVQISANTGPNWAGTFKRTPRDEGM